MREPEPSYARAVDKRPRGRRSRGAHEDQVEHVQEVLSRSSKLRELRSVEYARCAKVGAQLADGGCGVVCAGIRRLVRDEIGWQLAEQRRRAISLCLRAPQLFCTQPKACAKRARCMRLRWCARLRIKDIFAANLRGLGHQLRERAGSMLRAGVWPKTECTSQSHRTDSCPTLFAGAQRSRRPPEHTNRSGAPFPSTSKSSLCLSPSLRIAFAFALAESMAHEKGTGGQQCGRLAQQK